MSQPGATIGERSWHSQTIEATFSELRTTMSGLTTAEVEERRRASGTNAIPIRSGPSQLTLFVQQFQSPLIGILAIAAVVSFAFSEITDGWIILAVVAFNGIVGYIQEARAGEAMEKLRNLAPQTVRVLRDGEEHEIPADDLVVGDAVVLESGTIVPADGRVVNSVNLKMVESVFTGESQPVEKTADPLPQLTPMTERKNLLWRGTTVAGGRGLFAVTDVGVSTRFGKILGEVAATRQEPTPFQKNVAFFARRLAFVVIGLSAVVFMLSLARGVDFERSVLLSISLVVSLIPEGLPVVITLTFAWGMWRMARRRALIRKLIAVETLGSVTVIASDKTGTLTFGEMMVEEIVVADRRVEITGQGYKRSGDFFENEQRVSPLDDTVIRRLLQVGLLNNDSRLSHDEHGQERWLGDPTEIGLRVVAEKAGLRWEELNEEYPRVGEFPFDFSLKYMVTFHRLPDGRFFIAVKGAPRQIFSMCSTMAAGSGTTPFGEREKKSAHEEYERMAQRSLRGLAVSYAEITNDWRGMKHESLKDHLIYLGLVGIRDPLRPEASAAIAATKQAGIRVVMLTGDYRVTATAVAKELGITDGRDPHDIIDGSELEHMSEADLTSRLKQVSVFSRVSPEQKLRIATAYENAGEIIAMTGDGINDVPALKKANIGIAVGMTSTDAAKDVAEMVVTDGNLSSIVAAIEEGRAIFRNIQRVIVFLLASNLGELVLILCALLGGLPLPLLPIHIIWLNVITDPLLGIALAREPKSPYVMSEPPRSPAAPILSPARWRRITLNGAVIGASALAAFLVAKYQGRSQAETYAMTLTTLALGEWFLAFALRSGIRNALSGIRHNLILVLAFLMAVLMQLAILYVPPLAKAFEVGALGLSDWILMIVLGLVVVVVEEVRKVYARKELARRRT